MKQLIPFLVLFASCNKSPSQLVQPPPNTDRFEKVPQIYPLTRPIPEESRMADSRTFTEHLWAHEDSGNPPQLFLVKHEGFVTDSITLAGATNRDWEDIAVGKGPDDALSYIYVGDIGDNNSQYSNYIIYRVPEPKSFAEHNITVYDSIKFMYPDGSHDAEALLLDDATKDIFIITKRDAVSKVYKIPYPQDTQNMNQAVAVGDLAFSGVVSASQSAAGTEVIVKTYTNLFYYLRPAGEGLAVTLIKTPSDTLAYELEPQGEAVALANDNSGFFTYSEKGLSETFPNLLFYRRSR
jgi:hypothetical protein